MSEIDLNDFDEIIEGNDETIVVDDIDEKTGKRRNSKQQLKVRRAIEDHLDHKRFRKEVDYLSDYGFDD